MLLIDKNIWGCLVPLIYVKIYTKKEESDPAIPECSLTILYLLLFKVKCWETESCLSEKADGERGAVCRVRHTTWGHREPGYYKVNYFV